MHISVIALREVKMGFRNPWAYSFMALFTLFSMSLLLIQSQEYGSGYTSTSGTLLNLIVYLIPLMTLLLGSFSLTSEKEEGSWSLLSTYPVKTLSFLAGKYAGLALVLLTIIGFGYGLTGVLSALLGAGLSLESYALFFAFSIGLVFLFLAAALVIGTFANNRWQALTIGVAVWFFLIIGWSPLLIAFLGLLPYLWIKPALVVLTFLNPAELVRLFVIVKLGGGSILGPEYYQWVQWIQQASGTWMFLLICAVWITVSIGFSSLLWDRRRYRGS